MDPYLETPDLWPDVHHELISQIQATLNSTLRPKYVARVELRVYISDDDDPGREAWVPQERIEKPKHKRGRKTKAAPAVAIAEPLIVPLLLDEEIEEARLEIKHLETGALVTVIEVLSPTNKIRGGAGPSQFHGQASGNPVLGRALGGDRSVARGRAVRDPASLAAQRLSHPGVPRNRA
jgi:hypothetical protein